MKQERARNGVRGRARLPCGRSQASSRQGPAWRGLSTGQARPGDGARPLTQGRKAEKPTFLLPRSLVFMGLPLCFHHSLNHLAMRHH